ncbi:MAG: sel1 repeat family protein, partial [Methylobacteriaceae bacterium]|nr:sel1 repeat family protein [Methylobacteriaceae bacterium]
MTTHSGTSAYTLALPFAFKLGKDVTSDSQSSSQKVVNEKDPSYQYEMGERYFLGHGVLQHDAQAFAWYRKAAEQGYAPAQNSLGYMYINGRGTIQDEREALVWFQKAANQGNAKGLGNLAAMYEKGLGG